MRDLLRKLHQLLWPRERLQAAGLGVGMLVGAVLEMVGVGAIPAFVALLSDPASLQRSAVGGWAYRALGAPAPERLVLVGAGTLFALFVLKSGYLTVFAAVQSRFVHRLQGRFASRLVGAYLYSPYPFHLQRNTADLLRNANSEAMEVVGAGLMPVLQLAMEGLTVVALLGLLLAVEPAVSLAAFLVLGGVSVLFLRVARHRLLRAGQQTHEARGAMYRAANEGLGGIKVTKTLGREAHFLAAFERAAGAYAEAAGTRQVTQEASRLLLEVTAIAGLLGVAAFLLARGEAVSAIVPTLALLAVVVVRMIPSFNRITSALTTIRYGRAAVGAVYDDLRTLEAERPPPAAPLPFEEVLTLDGVRFRYSGAPEETLRGVTLRIPKGSAVGFAGTTGAGKTTLVDVILGLLTPTAGHVRVDGRDVHADVRAWQRNVGYVPQDVFLVDSTIRRNVALGLPDDAIDEAAVRRAVASAQLDDLVRRLPDGLDTVVGERGVRISGGQRQRIGIARALYHDPDVLVFDEATSALDHETERAVMEAVEALRGTRTILMIAHRLTTVAPCDHLYRLADGKPERVILEGAARDWTPRRSTIH